MKALLPCCAPCLMGVDRALGLAQETIGPDSTRSHPTVEQGGWPAGIVKLLRHEGPVYSIWVNGNEDVYFEASPGEVQELVTLFSRA